MSFCGLIGSRTSRVKGSSVVAFFLGMAIFAIQSHFFPVREMIYEVTTPAPTPRPVHYWDTKNSSEKFHKLPEAIIIGVKKGGTQALAAMMNLNTAVERAQGEVHFFDKATNFKNGLSWYLQQMPQAKLNQLVIESSPAYFVTSEVPKRVYAMNPKIKLLLIVRDPTLRMVSDYAHESVVNRVLKLPPLPPFESMVMKNNKINLENKALNISTYYYHMKNWLKYFPLQSFHLVDGDELVINPLPELKKVEDFLKLPSQITASNFQFSDTKGFFCWVKEGKESCFSAAKGRVHPKVDPAVIEKLIEFFHEPNRKFFELVGRTFNWR